MPRRGKTIQNQSLFTAALEGLELQRQRIEQQIQEVRAMLGLGTGRRGRPPGSGKKRRGRPPGSVNKKQGTRQLSAAARASIAAGQKRRWAEYRKSGGKAE